jgi:DNA-binding response OmpR family regulator
MSATTETQASVRSADTLRRRLTVVGGDRSIPEKSAISVLYVEDDADDVFLVGRQLSALAGFDVDYSHASTIAEARAAIGRHRPDVILCDFWLDSETTVPFIGELKVAAGMTPLVLVSTLDNDDIELIGRRAGADGFIAKADMTAACLGRVFSTLLMPPARQTARSGTAVVWLKALIQTLDRAESATQRMAFPLDASPDERGIIEAILGQSEDVRADLVDQLGGLEAAMQAERISHRFDVVPHLRHGIDGQRRRALGAATIAFDAPDLPVAIDADPALFGDVIDGFLAEAGDAVAAGTPVRAAIAVRDGALVLTLSRTGGGSGARPAGRLAEAAAEERRRVVRTLVGSSGGEVAFAGAAGRIGRLVLPLRRF